LGYLNEILFGLAAENTNPYLAQCKYEQQAKNILLFCFGIE